MKPNVLKLAAELSARGEPYVLATVVWRRAPSSGKEGATALITADRSVRGWIGGACAEPTVVREALRAIEEGTPRLLFMGTADELEAHRRDGVVSVPIACQSEGALEVYVEPVLPQPQLVTIGRSPAALALTSLVGRPGVANPRRSTTGARPMRTRAPIGSSASSTCPTSTIDRSWWWRPRATTTRTHSSGPSRHPLRTSGSSRLASGPIRCSATCAIVASRTTRSRASTRRPVSTSGTSRARRSPSRSWPRSSQLRATGDLDAPAAAEDLVRHESIDPVCGMTVDVTDARYRTSHEGRTVYFCSAGCLERFEADPASFEVATT